MDKKTEKKVDNKMKAVFAIIEDNKKEKSFFRRIGTCFVNRDSSLNVYLDALPLDGKLQIREIEPRPVAEAG